MRTICVVTTSRADYGLLRWLLRDLSDDPGIRLQVVVTGSHLSRHHGLTVSEIEADGFPIDGRIETTPAEDGASDVAMATGMGMARFAECFRRLQPDILVGLGDRYELFAAVSAAMLSNIPIAHLHGGESTEGLVDEAIRHAVTKMSHLHFVAAEPFARRVVQMGEDPSRVFTVGAFGLDALERIALLDREGLDRELSLPTGAALIAVTFHPITLQRGGAEIQMAELEAALHATEGAHVVWTLPNADAENGVIRRRIEAFRAAHPDRCGVFESLGQLRYLSLLRHARAVVGNSSSGIIEAPSLGVPTLDIGDRQKGRPRAASVVSCPPDRDLIAAFLAQALASPRKGDIVNPYGGPGASRKTCRILAEFPLEGLLHKSFHAGALDR